MKSTLGAWHCRQVGHVLADRDPGTEQLGVRGLRGVGRVVDVQRVDPDEGRSRLDEDIDGLCGEKWVLAEIRLGSPVPREIRPHENRMTGEGLATEDIWADRATGGRRVDHDDRKVRNALER